MNDAEFLFQRNRAYNASFSVIANSVVALLSFLTISIRFDFMWRTLEWNPFWKSFWWVFLVGSIIAGAISFIYIRIVMTIQPTGNYGWFSRKAVISINGWLEMYFVFGLIVFAAGICVLIFSFFK
jgi:hypothetical protein